MMLRLLALPCSFVVVLAAASCGGKAVVDGSPADGGGGSSSTITTTSHTTGTTPTTTWTTSSTTSSTGGGPGCYETSERFSFELRTYWGETFGCDAGEGTSIGDVSFQGVVMDAYQGYLLIDSCPPNADCVPMLQEIYYDAPMVPLYLPIGTYVELYARVEAPWACTHAVEIWNLPEWGGLPNPMLAERWLWLAANDGTIGGISPDDPLPYRVTERPLGCYPDFPSCGPPKDDFVLDFADATNPGNVLSLPMGESAEWAVGQSWQFLYLRNLRSYESGYCDDHWNFAYYAALQLYYE